MRRRRLSMRLSQPLSAAAAAVDRVRGVTRLYQDNLPSRPRRTRKLLQWQQVALKLSAENRVYARLAEGRAGKRGLVRYRAADRQFGSVTSGRRWSMPARIRVPRAGQAAIAEGGLIGRLTEVGSHAARVLLITDLNSRIPVVIPTSRTSAVLAGDNSDRPRLVFASEPKSIKIGDRVVTSGDGGVFPPGLPVGMVGSLDQGGARVEPYAELSQLGLRAAGRLRAGRRPAVSPAPVGRSQDRRGRAPTADEKKGALSGGAERVSSIPSLPRANRGLARFLPIATRCFAAALALLPLPVPGYAALTPAFTLMAVYHWSVYRPDLLPPSGLFAIGFAQDLRDRRHGPGERAGAAARARARCCVTGVTSSAGHFHLSGPGSRRSASAAMLGLWALHCVLQFGLFDLRTAMVRARADRCAVPGGQPRIGAHPARLDRRAGVTRSR